jgi:hypothetical protein
MTRAGAEMILAWIPNNYSNPGNERDMTTRYNRATPSLPAQTALVPRDNPKLPPRRLTRQRACQHFQLPPEDQRV